VSQETSGAFKAYLSLDSSSSTPIIVALWIDKQGSSSTLAGTGSVLMGDPSDLTVFSYPVNENVAKFEPTSSSGGQAVYAIAGKGENTDPCLLRVLVNGTAISHQCKDLGITPTAQHLSTSFSGTSDSPFLIVSDNSASLINSYDSLPLSTSTSFTNLPDSDARVRGIPQLSSAITYSYTAGTIQKYDTFFNPWKLKWTSNASFTNSVPAGLDLARNRIYVCAGVPQNVAGFEGHLVAYNLGNGQLIWDGTINQTPNAVPCSLDSLIITQDGGLLVSSQTQQSVSLYQLSDDGNGKLNVQRAWEVLGLQSAVPGETVVVWQDPSTGQGAILVGGNQISVSGSIASAPPSSAPASLPSPGPTNPSAISSAASTLPLAASTAPSTSATSIAPISTPSEIPQTLIDDNSQGGLNSLAKVLISLSAILVAFIIGYFVFAALKRRRESASCKGVEGGMVAGAGRADDDAELEQDNIREIPSLAPLESYRLNQPATSNAENSISIPFGTFATARNDKDMYNHQQHGDPMNSNALASGAISAAVAVSSAAVAGSMMVASPNVSSKPSSKPSSMHEPSVYEDTVEVNGQQQHRYEQRNISPTSAEMTLSSSIYQTRTPSAQNQYVDQQHLQPSTVSSFSPPQQHYPQQQFMYPRPSPVPPSPSMVSIYPNAASSAAPSVASASYPNTELSGSTWVNSTVSDANSKFVPQNKIEQQQPTSTSMRSTSPGKASGNAFSSPNTSIVSAAIVGTGVAAMSTASNDSYIVRSESAGSNSSKASHHAKATVENSSAVLFSRDSLYTTTSDNEHDGGTTFAPISPTYEKKMEVNSEEGYDDARSTSDVTATSEEGFQGIREAYGAGVAGVALSVSGTGAISGLTSRSASAGSSSDNHTQRFSSGSEDGASKRSGGEFSMSSKSENVVMELPHEPPKIECNDVPQALLSQSSGHDVTESNYKMNLVHTVFSSPPPASVPMAVSTMDFGMATMISPELPIPLSQHDLDISDDDDEDENNNDYRVYPGRSLRADSVMSDASVSTNATSAYSTFSSEDGGYAASVDSGGDTLERQHSTQKARVRDSVNASSSKARPFSTDSSASSEGGRFSHDSMDRPWSPLSVEEPSSASVPVGDLARTVTAQRLAATAALSSAALENAGENSNNTSTNSHLTARSGSWGWGLSGTPSVPSSLKAGAKSYSVNSTSTASSISNRTSTMGIGDHFGENVSDDDEVLGGVGRQRTMRPPPIAKKSSTSKSVAPATSSTQISKSISSSSMVSAAASLPPLPPTVGASAISMSGGGDFRRRSLERSGSKGSRQSLHAAQQYQSDSSNYSMASPGMERMPTRKSSSSSDVGSFHSVMSSMVAPIKRNPHQQQQQQEQQILQHRQGVPYDSQSEDAGFVTAPESASEKSSESSHRQVNQHAKHNQHHSITRPRLDSSSSASSLALSYRQAQNNNISKKTITHQSSNASIRTMTGPSDTDGGYVTAASDRTTTGRSGSEADAAYLTAQESGDDSDVFLDGGMTSAAEDGFETSLEFV
jgi:hypothetical protein